MSTICFDIDGVIARGEGAYAKRTLVLDADAAIMSAFSQGHRIVLHTSRYESSRAVTKSWLKRYGIPYHRLIMGKPKADFYIDDKGRRFTGWHRQYF